MGSWVERKWGKVIEWGTRRQLANWEFPHSCVDKPGGKTGETD